MNGTATTCSSETATRSSAHISSIAAATRPWGPSGAISTSRRLAGRRLGRTRQKVIPKRRRTSGGTGMTTTEPSPALTPSGLIFLPTPQVLPLEGARKKRRRVKERRPLRHLDSSFFVVDPNLSEEYL